jgi:hypothetical protein
MLEVNRAQPWVRTGDILQNRQQNTSEPHPLLWGQVTCLFIHEEERLVTDGPWTPASLWHNAQRTQSKVIIVQHHVVLQQDTLRFVYHIEKFATQEVNMLSSGLMRTSLQYTNILFQRPR